MQPDTEEWIRKADADFLSMMREMNAPKDLNYDLICFLAQQSLESKWVMQEIGLAHELGKTMIPVFQESYVEPSLPDDDSPLRALISHQGIKLFDVSGFYVDHAVTDLARLVHGVMNGDADIA